MKKITALVFALIMLTGLCAAGSAEEWVFERGVTIVCPWGLNGGADSTIRPMSALLEQYVAEHPFQVTVAMQSSPPWGWTACALKLPPRAWT